MFSNWAMICSINSGWVHTTFHAKTKQSTFWFSTLFEVHIYWECYSKSLYALCNGRERNIWTSLQKITVALFQNIFTLDLGQKSWEAFLKYKLLIMTKLLVHWIPFIFYFNVCFFLQSIEVTESPVHYRDNLGWFPVDGEDNCVGRCK